MKLNILERLVLSGILPAKGDYLTIKKISELRENLINFSDDEIKTYEINIHKDGWSFNRKKAIEYVKEFQIGELCHKEIREVLKKKNEDRILESSEITLYEKFVEKGYAKSD